MIYIYCVAWLSGCLGVLLKSKAYWKMFSQVPAFLFKFFFSAILNSFALVELGFLSVQIF